MSRSPRVLVAVVALVAALGLPAVVSADTTGGGIEPAASNGATVTVVGVKLQTKLLATVTLDVTCQPLVERDWDGNPTGTTRADALMSGFVQLMQAQGRSIAHAAGYMAQMEAGQSVTCDGSTFRVSVQVVAQDLPLKRGDALVGAIVSMSAPEGECCSTWSWDSASSGPIAVKIR